MPLFGSSTRRSAVSLKSQPRQIAHGLEASTSTQTRRPIRRLIVFFLALGSAIALIIGVTALLLYNSYNRARHDGKALAAGITVEPFVSLPGDSIFPIGLAAAPDGTFYLTQFGTGSI